MPLAPYIVLTCSQPFGALQEMTCVVWRAPEALKPHLVRTQSFSRQKHTEHDSQGRLASPGTVKGSWLRATLPHLHRTLSSSHSLSVTTIRRFETKLAYMLVPGPSHSSNNCTAQHSIAEYSCTLPAAVV